MFSKLLVLASSIALSLPGLFILNKSVGDNFTLSNMDGDDFVLTEQSYDIDEGFVYTTRVHYNEGQACGVVFGAEQDDHYWVFNIDRYDNRTKLMYFYKDGGNLTARVLREEYFIGNDKTVTSEFNVINPALRECPDYNFKVVITKDEDKMYGEFFIDNIKRFGVDSNIDLASFSDITYSGGKLGYNVYRANVEFKDITYGKNDFSYYTELYRNQFHYSQYAHWNNDPNGMVYYNGYYHLYYQTNPFSQQWGGMYWGHARSRDLVHWQELPIALFPDDGNMGVGWGTGWAWSGMAMVYRKGMSAKIDEKNWFPNGDGTGLFGIYTRDGCGNSQYSDAQVRQDQVIITSDDGGLTWVKRKLIPQSVAAVGIDYKVDCRDPSIFKLNDYTWGMALSGGTQNKVWFLKSKDLLDWSYVGELNYEWPECATVSYIKADDNTYHHVITISSRKYLICDIGYIELYDDFYINRVTPEFVTMDYGNDSYAAQCFYIDDTTSKYYGQSISMSWSFGLPDLAESGKYADARYPWNGGFTVPVSLGITRVGDSYRLTQTPITVNNDDYEKETITTLNSASFNNETNPLDGIATHLLELEASISNPNEESVEFRVNVSDFEYTSFGWNKEDGYYFDRRNTSDAGIHFEKVYHHKFITGPVDGKNLSFYVLVENGSLELFANNYQYVFYNNTLATPYSVGASLTVGGEVMINTLKVNEMKSVWKDFSSLDEGLLYLSSEEVNLDMTLSTSKEVMAYASNMEEVSWEIVSGNDVVKLDETISGAKFTALKAGTASIKASACGDEKIVTVNVNDSVVEVPFELNKEDIYSGSWRTEDTALVGEQRSGDGFYISSSAYRNVTYTASFNLSKANAAGLLLRASKDMSNYIMVNYDKEAKRSKVWTPNHMIMDTEYDAGSEDIILSADLNKNHLIVAINNHKVNEVDLGSGDPEYGYIGLNVFNGEVKFSNASIIETKEVYEFENRDVLINTGLTQYIRNIYNLSRNNEVVAKGFYSVNENQLTLKKEYVRLLDENKTYEFYVEGELTTFNFKLEVGEIERTYSFPDLYINQGQEVTVYVDVLNVSSVKIDGETISSDKYFVKDYLLHIDASLFDSEEMTIVINNIYSFKVYVNLIPAPTPVTPTKEGCSGNIETVSYLLAFTSLIGISLIIISKSRGKKND